MGHMPRIGIRSPKGWLSHGKPLVQDGGLLEGPRAEQLLGQEQACFDQAQFQDKCFFALRVAMGILALLAIPMMIVICVLIIFDAHQDVLVKRLAATALFVSIIGLMTYVWRVFLIPSAVSRLMPVTANRGGPPAGTG